VVDDAVATTRKGLGLDPSASIEAEPYKLLLYALGGKFKPHRDSIKAEGMFGTLAIFLPSDFEVGEGAAWPQWRVLCNTLCVLREAAGHWQVGGRLMEGQ